MISNSPFFFQAQEQATNPCISLHSSTDPFGDGSLLTKYEFEGNVNDTTTTHNGTAYNLTYGTGRFGSSAGSFDGTSSRVDISGIPTRQNDFSVSFFCKMDNPTGTSQTAFDLLKGLQFYGFNFNHDGFKVKIGTYGTSTADYLSTNNLTLTTDWMHFVYTKSSTAGAALYKDGVNIAENTGFTHNIATGSNLYSSIGAYNGGASQFFDGLIDQFEYYTKALTASEVYQLYTQSSCVSVPTDGLVATYLLDSDATDSTGTADGTANGTIDYLTGFSAGFDGGGTEWIDAPYTDSTQKISFSIWADSSNLTNQTIAHPNAGTYSVNLLNGNAYAVRSDHYGCAFDFNSALPADGTWYHLTFTYDYIGGGLLEMYINGSSVGSASGFGTYYGFDVGATTGIVLARQSQGFGRYYAGDLSNARVYDRILSASEVANIYNAELAEHQ